MREIFDAIRSALAIGSLLLGSATTAQTTLYVNGSCGNDAWSGTSLICEEPDGPKQTIQAAIVAAVDGDEIVVAPATYNELVNFIGKAIVLRSSDGPGVTVLDGAGLNNSVVRCISGEGPDTVLEGFTITNGTGVPSGDPVKTLGGGIFIEQSSLAVKTCWIVGNGASGPDGRGGGVFIDSSTNACLISECVFEGNHSESSDGGGLYASSSEVTLVGCSFNDNHAAVGGGVYFYYNTGLVLDCTFKGNTSTHEGGGLLLGGTSNAAAINCEFQQNSAGIQGGAVATHDQSALTLLNVTLAANSAPAYGAIRVRSPGITVACNSLLWNNGPDAIEGARVSISHSNVQGGFAGEGNIDADPLFINPAAGNYRLQLDSPCADAGDNDAVPNDVLTDLDGNPRFVDSCASDTGNGEAPIVDMGAYETLTCRVDLTLDCTVNTQDFLVFLGLWVLRDPIADWDGNGTVNTQDFLAYLNDWVAGC